MAEQDAVPNVVGTADDNAIPKPDLVVEAGGRTGADLAYSIENALQQVEIGGGVEVQTDAPDAREVVLRWAAQTGNDIVATLDGRPLRFYVLRREAPAPQRTPYS